MTDVTDALKPCPFCGSVDVFNANSPHGVVIPNVACMDCGARGPVPDREMGEIPGEKHEAEAIAAWNTRTASPADAAPDEDALSMFVRESNRIEGITETTDAHVEAYRKFLDGAITIPALIELVSVLQPDARFRNSPGVPHVRVGDHVAPPSGPDIEGNLRSILAMRDPWEQHIAYEALHPFTDGNGRSGRAVWLHRHWHETGLDAWAVRRGFLHSFYYHTLSGVRLATSTPRESPLAKL